MKPVVKLGVLAATTALCFSGTGYGGSAEAVVSGFSIRNEYTGKCLNAPGYNAALTEVTCDKNSANQRWANVGQKFENRFPSLGGWCLTGTSHEQRAYLRVCSNPGTTWSINSLHDDAKVKIWNGTCGYLKVMPHSVVGCGARTVAPADWWVIDY